MKIRFVDVAVGSAFYYQGKRFVKLALSMAEDAERTGTIFMDAVEVDTADEGQDEP